MKNYQEVCGKLIDMLEDLEESLEEIEKLALMLEQERELEDKFLVQNRAKNELSQQ